MVNNIDFIVKSLAWKLDPRVPTPAQRRNSINTGHSGVPLKYIERSRYYDGYISGIASNVQGLAPATIPVQKWIHAHQFPNNCNGKTFSIVKGASFPNGLGSCIHILSSMLAHSLQKGHILLYDENVGSHFSDQGRNFDQYFQPISNCSMEHGLAANDTEFLSFGSYEATVVPAEAQALVKEEDPNMPPDAMKYWWRGQGAAFLMHFNENLVTNIMRVYSSLNGPYLDFTGSPPHLPAGVVSMHIRGTDKQVEMTLVPPKIFVEKLIRVLQENPQHLVGAFISSEDPNIMKQVQNFRRNWTEKNAPSIPRPWHLYTITMEQLPGAVPLEQIKILGANKIFPYLMLQLMIHLQCDAFIGQRGSNWIRLIDELRCAWVPKCSAPFYELGNDNSWRHYNWRRKL